MNEIVLRKSDDGNYYYMVAKRIVDSKHELLKAFLTDDVRSVNTVKHYKNKLAVKNSQYGGCANATCLGYDDQNVYLEFAFECDGNPELVLPKKVFLYILDEWEQVLIHRPDQIIITLHDDQTVTFEQIFEARP